MNPRHRQLLEEAKAYTLAGGLLDEVIRERCAYVKQQRLLGDNDKRLYERWQDYGCGLEACEDTGLVSRIYQRTILARGNVFQEAYSRYLNGGWPQIHDSVNIDFNALEMRLFNAEYSNGTFTMLYEDGPRIAVDIEGGPVNGDAFLNVQGHMERITHVAEPDGTMRVVADIVIHGDIPRGSYAHPSRGVRGTIGGVELMRMDARAQNAFDLEMAWLTQMVENDIPLPIVHRDFSFTGEEIKDAIRREPIHPRTGFVSVGDWGEWRGSVLPEDATAPKPSDDKS